MNTNKTQAEQLPQDAFMQSVLAKDLRLGNKLLFLGDVVTFKNITEIREDGVFWIKTTEPKIESKNFYFKPIPLTEEWLFKLGFINDRVLEFYRNDFTDSTIIIDYNFICLLGYSHVKLKYVHQLQNLYFALTGSELTVA
jgi:hypothetical protein